MSDKVQALEVMLQAYLSTCSDTQVIEALDVLKKIISDIENDNLAQEKDADSTEETDKEESKERRAPNVIYDIELAKKVYNAAKKFPNYSMDRLDEKLGLPATTIRTAKTKILFKGEYRKLNNICKLGRLMCGKDERRYRREINNYDDME